MCALCNVNGDEREDAAYCKVAVFVLAEKGVEKWKHLQEGLPI
jgi:hypothetical protein